MDSACIDIPSVCDIFHVYNCMCLGNAQNNFQMCTLVIHFNKHFTDDHTTPIVKYNLKLNKFSQGI